VRRLLLFVLLFVTSTAALGCGNSRERGKNKDYDRPTTKQK
jgi:hypothetical protein